MIRVACRIIGAGSSSTTVARRRQTYASITFAFAGSATENRRNRTPLDRPSANNGGSEPPVAPSPLFTNARSLGLTTHRRALSTAGFTVGLSG
jgi:hypothetical protein